jgi:hypothetical protein
MAAVPRYFNSPIVLNENGYRGRLGNRPLSAGRGTDDSSCLTLGEFKELLKDVEEYVKNKMEETLGQQEGGDDESDTFTE